MVKNQFPKDFYKKPGFILSLILLGFFFREVALAAIFPIFNGQDESRHYNTVQFLNEPEEKNWITREEPQAEQEKERLETYRYSDEIKQTAVATGTQATRGAHYEKMDFANSYVGKNEEEINMRKWDPYNKDPHPDTAGISKKSLYHFLALQIEKFFSQESILVRFFSIRVFSVLLGTITIFLFYLLIKNTGFSKKESLLMAAIISFQPKLSTYLTNINYDALLILLFALFSLGGVLSLKEGINWKNLSIMISAVILGLFTKGTGIVLAGVFLGLVIYHTYKKIKEKKWGKRHMLACSVLIIMALAAIHLKFNLINLVTCQGEGAFTGMAASAGNYLSSSLPKIKSSSENYWGNLDWRNTNYSELFIRIIWIAEFFALVGLFLYFKNKKKPDFLPEKKYILFFIGIIIALQAGVRFYDWKIYTRFGSLELGTPGRYFLPSIAAHFILVFTGIGALLKNRNYFKNSLIIGLILMSVFFMVTVLNIIIPDYYL